ncbi:MAG TPA: hypothetical protein PKE58_22355 [Acidobacteriota bacterium]|nr:hypothetical protein [Acidobacteriota bacterium]
MTVLTATDIEFRAAASLLEKFRRFETGPFGGFGFFHGRRIDLYMTGMGPHNAATASREIFKRSKAEYVLVGGLAGAIAPECQVGDLVLYSACEFAETTFPRLQTNHHLTAVLNHEFQSGKVPLHCGTGLMARRMLCLANEKQAWGRQYPAKAVDMESYHMVRFAHQAGKQIAVLRVISDDAHHDVPDFNRALDETYQVRNFKVFLELARHPLLAVRFLRNVNLSVKRLKQVFAVAFAADF